jgi:uncharacterized protein (TIGR04222 family)
VALVVLFLALPLHPVQAQSKTLYWERFDVDITVQTDGSFVVEETQVIVFTSGTFREGYRSIPADRFSSITDVSAWEDGEPTRVSVDRGGDEYEIVWDLLEPRSDSRHTYVLRYTVNGGLRYYDGGDQIWWKAVFADRSFPVRASTVTVNLPDDAPAQVAEAYGVENSYMGVGGQRVIFTAEESVDPGEEFEVRVQFPHGVVSGSPAAWQRMEDSAPVINLILGVIGGLILIGGPLALLVFWYLRGRDPRVELPADYLSKPPSDAPPGVAGTLVDEKADMEDILATLIDLARRGYLEIEEQPSAGLFGTSYDFVFRRTDKAMNGMKPYERTLLRRVTGRSGERSMSDLKEEFYTALPKIRDGLYDEMVERGYFRRRPDRVRKIYSGFGMVVLFGLFFVGVFGLAALAEISAAFICPVIGLGVSAVTLMIVGRHMPVKTRQGAEAAAKWNAFKTYLKEIERYADLEEATAQYERYLPYAIAFGIERSWTRKFSQVESTPVPVWYFPAFMHTGRRRTSSMGGVKAPGVRPGPSSGGASLDSMSRGLGSSLDSMSRGLGRMLDSASSTFVSRPSSSSSGGGGGFSGGGFSGGGGGGGGGGGFR